MATESKGGGLQAVITQSDRRRENGNDGPDPATAWRRSGTDEGGGPSPPLFFFLVVLKKNKRRHFYIGSFKPNPKTEAGNLAKLKLKLKQ